MRGEAFPAYFFDVTNRASTEHMTHFLVPALLVLVFKYWG
jgi:hypothetical protein